MKYTSRIAYLFLVVVYYVAAWSTLSQFDAGLVTASFVLFGLPAAVLAYYSYAPKIVLLSISFIALGIALLFETLAHIYGLWYTIGVDATRVFGLVPVEVLFMTVFEVIFLTLLYELIFDDGVYTVSTVRMRFGAVLVFALGVIILTSIHGFAAENFFLSYSFVWILVIILGSSLAALSVYRVYSAQFLDRLINFSLVGSIPSLLALFLSVTNTHKVYANSNEYLFTLNVFGEMVPLEAFLLTLALPFFVATVYELFLDDRS